MSVMASFLFGRLALRALAQAAQEILGGRSGPAHLANMMELLSDDRLVEIEKVRAFPRLRQRLPEYPVERLPRNGAPAEARNHRMHLRGARGIAQREIDVV